jgi:hypothetical protein
VSTAANAPSAVDVKIAEIGSSVKPTSTKIKFVYGYLKPYRASKSHSHNGHHHQVFHPKRSQGFHLDSACKSVAAGASIQHPPRLNPDAPAVLSA